MSLANVSHRMLTLVWRFDGRQSMSSFAHQELAKLPAVASNDDAQISVDHAVGGKKGLDLVLRHGRRLGLQVVRRRQRRAQRRSLI